MQDDKDTAYICEIDIPEEVYQKKILSKIKLPWNQWMAHYNLGKIHTPKSGPRICFHGFLSSRIKKEAWGKKVHYIQGKNRASSSKISKWHISILEEQHVPSS